MTEEFGQLKAAWKTFIDETVDHSFFYNWKDPILPSLEKHIENFRGLPFPGDPTTELIASLFLKKALVLYRDSRLKPSALRLQDPPTNQVRVSCSAMEKIEAQIAPSHKFPTTWWNSPFILQVPGDVL